MAQPSTTSYRIALHLLLFVLLLIGSIILLIKQIRHIQPIHAIAYASIALGVFVLIFATIGIWSIELLIFILFGFALILVPIVPLTSIK